MTFGWDYPPGAEHDPRAPWNEKPNTDCVDCGDDTGDEEFERCKPCYEAHEAESEEQMDPQANLARQRHLAAEIIRRADALVPDDMLIARLAAELADLVIALDEWRMMGGFDPYPQPLPNDTRKMPMSETPDTSPGILSGPGPSAVMHEIFTNSTQQGAEAPQMLDDGTDGTDFPGYENDGPRRPRSYRRPAT